jgi:hypothetical protein
MFASRRIHDEQLRKVAERLRQPFCCPKTSSQKTESDNSTVISETEKKKSPGGR